MKDILFTGVAGFIGARTAELLLKQNINVIGVDNLNNYYNTRIKIHRLKNLMKFNSFKFIEGDIEDKNKIDLFFQNIKLMLL